MKKCYVFAAVFALCLLLVSCGSSGSKSENAAMKMYSWGDLSYSVPASWSADIDDPEVSFMQYSDEDDALVMVSRYEAGAIEWTDLFDTLSQDGIEYEEISAAIKNGTAITGASYVNEDGYTVNVFSLEASSGDRYDLSILSKDETSSLAVKIMATVEIQ